MSNSGSANKKQLISSKDAGYKDTLDQYFDKIKSYVTHNKGSTWELIRAPEKDMNGNSFQCYIEDDCSLHLQMYSHKTAQFASPYSVETAIGIVVAVGNVGHSVDFTRSGKKSTFLSRDGGLNFNEISSIPLIYDLGDHGGLIVAAPNLQSTTQIRYSWNEGKTWSKLKISDVPIFVSNIIQEPKSTSQ